MDGLDVLPRIDHHQHPMKTLLLTTITAALFGTLVIADEDKAGVKEIDVKRTSIQRVECDTAEEKTPLIDISQQGFQSTLGHK